MGLKIYKAAGWGLTDVADKDPRVNWSAEPFGYEGRAGHAYLPWLAERTGARREAGADWFSYDYFCLASHDGLARFGDKPVWESVTYRAECGLPNVLVIRPFCLPDWSRCDDTIDYTGELLTRYADGPEDWCRPVRGGIFPFSGLFMDADTGTALPHDAVQWVRMINSLDDRGLATAERQAALDMAARSFTPFSSEAEARRRVVPLVPSEVRDVAEFLELFTAPGTWTSLRPVLYTYWA